MRKKFYFTVLLFILLPVYCMAAQYAVKKQDVSFGKFTQTSENAEIYLSPDGSVTAVGGRVSNGVAGVFKTHLRIEICVFFGRYETGRNGENAGYIFHL